MKSLKIILYLICITCVGWILLFFGGPSLIKWSVNSYFGDQLIIANVEITPSLDINISRLDFDFQSGQNENSISGHSRGVKLTWSLYPDRSFLKLNLGPTQIKNTATFNSIELKTASFSNFDLNRIPIYFRGKNISSNYGSIEEIYLDAFILDDFSSASSVTASLTGLNFDLLGLGFVEQMVLKSEEVKLNLAKLLEDSKFNISANSLNSPMYSTKAMGLSGQFSLYSSKLNFDVDLLELESTFVPAVVRKLKVFGQYGKDMNLKPITLVFSDAKLFDKNVNSKSFMLNVFSPSPSSFELHVDGDISIAELRYNGTVIGSVPKSSLTAHALFSQRHSRLVSEVQFDFEAANELRLDGVSHFTIKLPIDETILVCNSLNCELSELTVKYKVSVDDEAIAGVSSCLLDPCSVQQMSHNLSTSNTHKIFQRLSDFSLINPLVLTYLYSVFLSGEKSNYGHKINM